MQTSAHDPVIAEVRAIRDEFAAEHGYSVAAIFEGLRKSLESSSQSGTHYVRIISGTIAPVSETLQQLGHPVAPVLQKLTEISAKAAPYLAAFARWNNAVDAVNESGWLPYRTVTYDAIKKFGYDADKLDRFFSEFHHSHWSMIRDEMASRSDSYDIDTEARQTFLEALYAHENKLYRCVCRVLFPEIERILAVRGIKTKNLEEWANSQSLGKWVSSHPFGFVIFNKLMIDAFATRDKHSNEEDVIPNRHAALHGFVRYSSHKNSMNMLVLTDYVFDQLLPSR